MLKTPFLTTALLAITTTLANAGIKITPDVVYGHKHGMALTMDIYQPEQARGLGVLFMVSGGWYSRWAPPIQTQPLFQPLLDAGFTVFAVRHGSSPKFVIPEIVEDVRRSVRFVRTHAADFGIDPERLGVCGGSAGGHLSLMLGTTSDEGDPDASDVVQRASSRVAAVVAYFPPTDLGRYVQPGKPYVGNFPALDFDRQKIAAMSPLLNVSQDDAPTLLVHGDEDELVPISHSQQMAKAFDDHGVDHELMTIKGAGHGFAGEDRARASTEMIAWFNRQLAGDDSVAKSEATGKPRQPKPALKPNAGRDHDRRELLWPEGAPGALGDAPSDMPALTIHLPPESKANGAAVIVNPGGGYRVLAADHEGLQVARELNRHGVTAFVLRYRVGPKYEPSAALLDAQRAIRYVRHHADRFQIDSTRIGMLGFSAGGHLAAAAGTSFEAGDPQAGDPVDRLSSRPDFLALVYPAISGTLFDKENSYPSTHTKVTEKAPPTFLVHTHEDSLSPQHSVLFYQSLLEHGVPAELHIFGYGPHGTGLAPGDPDLGQWPTLLVNWMRRSGLTTAQRRVSVSGQVTVDGEPLFWGWLTFIPEDANHPPTSAYLGWHDAGKFAIDSAHGPCPGRYRLQVRRVAKHFDDQQAGAYSMEDVELYETDENGAQLFVEIAAEDNEDIAIRAGSAGHRQDLGKQTR